MNRSDYSQMSSEALAQVVQDQLNLDRTKQRVAELEARVSEFATDLDELHDAAAEFAAACMAYWFMSCREHHDPGIAHTFAELERVLNEISGKKKQ